MHPFEFAIGNILNGGAGNDILWGGLESILADQLDLSNSALFDLPPGIIGAEAPAYGNYRIVPKAAAGHSIDGQLNDGDDILSGGAGRDLLFGGSDIDTLNGDEESDYCDGGAGADLVKGGSGDDVIRGGAGDDKVDGDSGIDLVYGDDGSDHLYGDADSGFPQMRQRLYGGEGDDYLYAFALTFTPVEAMGDELLGEAGNDRLYGNVRQEILDGGPGNDYLYGDYLAGPLYNPNPQASFIGAADQLYGGPGQDLLFGGGGHDTLWGGADGDWIAGQQGNDTLYGGGGIDFLILDVGLDNGAGAYDSFDGHHGNQPWDERPADDDNATDILQIEGTPNDDTITISADSGAPNALLIQYNNQQIQATWRDGARILVEQFRVSGGNGNDRITFAPSLDVTDLINRSSDYVTLLEGGEGDDILVGTAGRDRLDGGRGNDVLYGLGGDDRLWGDPGTGDITDHDVLFGGQGHDDLIGGMGSNHLYAWTFEPGGLSYFGLANGQEAAAVGGLAVLRGLKPMVGGYRLPYDLSFQLLCTDGNVERRFDFVLTASATSNNQTLADLAADLNAVISSHASAALAADGTVEIRADTGSLQILSLDADAFGVFVDSGGNFHDSDGGGLYRLEDTGLNRVLGGPHNDDLYGGTGLDFLYGGAGDDNLYTWNGVLFENSSVAVPEQDAWKAYARQTDKVWYYCGTNADDQITVDFVTEPGLLQDHHLITRLTNHNGSYSFDAQVRLDFQARDAQGRLIWNPQDLSAQFNALFGAGSDDTRSAALASLNFTQADLEAGLLPPEGDFLAIIIDALAGNDQVTVGPTVQRTVWIDAGAGDDRVEIRPGSTILSDSTERGHRNDVSGQALNPVRAYDLSRYFSSSNVQFKGLTMDNPADVDWYRFTLPAAPGSGSDLLLESSSPDDGLGLGLFHFVGDNLVAINPVSLTGLETGAEYLLQVTTPKQIPTLYSLLFQWRPGTGTETVNLAQESRSIRRDIILGGAGHDILSGGSGEDWIFGGPGDDVLTGGLDRQAEDLLFGEEGNDTYQIVPDGLPWLTNGTGTFIPSFQDRFDGGLDDDRVLFLGGDLDRLGEIVPDYVAIRFDRNLQRYEFTNLVWDIANKTFLRADTPAVLTGTDPVKSFTLGGQTAEFKLSLNNGTPLTITVSASDNTSLEDLVADINDALRPKFQNAVAASLDSGRIRFVTTAVGFEVTLAITEANDTTRNILHLGNGWARGVPTAWVQNYAYYQVVNTEHTVIDTRSGKDVVRADPWRLFDYDPSEWGIKPGNFQEGAYLAGLDIRGGPGDDWLFGGASDDRIDGGEGADHLFGGPGEDHLYGGSGNDVIYGDSYDHATDLFDLYRDVISTKPAERFVFELARPHYGLVTDTSRPGINLSDPGTHNLDNAVGWQTGEALTRMQRIGDFNGDQRDDFILSGAEQSYIFFGPVRLDNLYAVADQASVIIEHDALGEPAQRFGDLNGDGFADLAFVRYEGTDTIVTVLLGGQLLSTSPSVDWPRHWEHNFLTRLENASRDGNPTSREILLNDAQLDPSNVTLQALNWHGNDKNLLLSSASAAESTSWSSVWDAPNSIAPGPDILSSVAEYAGALYFTVNGLWEDSSVYSRRLRRFDGVSAPNIQGNSYYGPDSLVAFNGLLYFTAMDSQTNSRGIWTYDGDARLQEWKFDNVQFSLDNGPWQSANPLRNPRALAVAGQPDQLYYIGYTSTNKEAFACYSPSENKVRAFSFASINSIKSPLSTGSYLSNGSKHTFVIFWAEDSAGVELWYAHADLPLPAPLRITDINPGPGSASSDSTPKQFIQSGNKLSFAADDGPQRFSDGRGAHGTELWEFNLESNIASMTKNIRLDTEYWDPQGNLHVTPVSSDPWLLGAYHDSLYFRANLGTEGNELWRYNSQNTQSGQLTLFDINPQGNSYVAGMTEFQNKLFFTAWQNGSFKVFQFDGTEPSVVQGIPSLNALFIPDISPYTPMGVLNGLLYYWESMDYTYPTDSGRPGIVRFGPPGPQGYVISDLETSSNKHLSREDLIFEMVFNQFSLASQWQNWRSDVVGDLNGDGLDDLFFSHPDYQGLALGRTGSPGVDLNSTLDLGLFPDGTQGIKALELGDLNRDGYDDVGLINGSRLYVFYGAAATVPTIPTTIFARQNPADPLSGSDRVIDNTDGGSWTAVVSGDFNGDGQADLALSSSAGRIVVKWSVTSAGTPPPDNVLTARVSLTILSGTPWLDLNDDRVSDLVVGTPTGTAYVIYGMPRRTVSVPQSGFTELANRSLPGIGAALVDDGSGQPYVKSGQWVPPPPGQALWYRFALLGDGQPGTQIRLLPDTPGELVTGDLFDAAGGQLAYAQTIIDLRRLKAADPLNPGTLTYYYLRVTSTTGADFTFEIHAPEIGVYHPISNRDELHGGDGDDELTGNGGLDRMFGESGNDIFTASAIEVIDPEWDEEPNPYTDTGDVAATGWLSEVDPAVTFPDLKLKAAVAKELGLPVTKAWNSNQVEYVRTPIYASDMARLTSLDHGNLGIATVQGLEEAVNLAFLDLHGNGISSLTPLQSLRALEILDVSGNMVISDLGPLSGLHRLRELYLGNNSISDLTPLNGLTALERVDLSNNHISELGSFLGQYLIDDGDWEFLTIVESDFLDLPLLAGKLEPPSRAFDAWLKTQLSPATQTALSNYQTFGSLPALRMALVYGLVQDLYRIIRGPSIFDSDRFEGVELRAGTNALLLQNSHESELVHLNRLLLEDAYPVELSRTQWPSGYSEPNGRWSRNLHAASGVLGGDYRFLAPGSAGTAQWRFSNLPNQSYQVLVTWPNAADTPSFLDPSRAAAYSVTGTSAPIILSQLFQPDGIWIAGVRWQLLTVANPDNQGNIVVTLTGAADGLVNADAVRLMQMDVLPNLAYLDVRGNPVSNPGYQVFLPALQSRLSAGTILTSISYLPPTPAPVGPQAQAWADGSRFLFLQDVVQAVPGNYTVVASTNLETVSVQVLYPTDPFMDPNWDLMVVWLASPVPSGPIEITLTTIGQGASEGRTSSRTFDLIINGSVVTGRKFYDRDRNGSDSGEFGVQGATIFAETVTGNGQLDPGECFALSDRNGDYALWLPTVSFQPYQIVEVGSPAWLPSSGAKTVGVIAAARVVSGVDFGNFLVAYAFPDLRATEGVPVTLNGGIVDPNPNDGSNFTYRWLVNGVLFAAGENPVFTSSGGLYHATVPFTFTPGDDGVYDITLEAEDQDVDPTLRLTFRASTTVFVTNVVPTVHLGPDRNTLAGVPIRLVDLFSDPGFNASHRLKWTLTNVDGRVVDLGSKSVYQEAEDALSFVLNEAGDYTLSLEVTDDKNASTTGHVQILVRNRAPAVNLGADLVVDEGAALTWPRPTWPTLVTDPGTNQHSYLWWLTDNHGVVLQTSTATAFTFTPPNEGTYLLNLLVTDQDQAAGYDQVVVTAINAAPVVNLGPDLNVNEGTTLAWPGPDWPTVVTDPGTNTLSYQWRLTDDQNREMQTSTAATFAYTLPDNRTYLLRLAVTDDRGAIGYDEVTITAVNVAPVVTLGPDLAVEEGAIVAWPRSDWLTVFTDAGSGDSHEFSWQVSRNGEPFFPVPENPNPNFSPNLPFSFGAPTEGTYLVTLTVRDDDGASATGSVRVVVSNVLPSFLVSAPSMTETGQPVIITGQFTDPGADRWTGTIRWAREDGTQESFGTLLVSDDHSFAAIIAFAEVGRYQVEVTLRDGDPTQPAGVTKTVAVDVQLWNEPPAVVAGDVNDGVSGLQHSNVTAVTLTFSEDVGSTLAPEDFRLRNLSTGQDVDLSSLSVNYDAGNKRARLTFHPGQPNQPLPEGRYELALAKANLYDSGGKPLAANYVLEFYALSGDTNGDRRANDLDLFRVWQNLLQNPGSRDLNEDLNADGVVNEQDVNLVADNYLSELDLSGMAASPPQLVLMDATDNAALPLPQPAARPGTPADEDGTPPPACEASASAESAVRAICSLTGTLLSSDLGLGSVWSLWFGAGRWQSGSGPASPSWAIGWPLWQWWDQVFKHKNRFQ